MMRRYVEVYKEGGLEGFQNIVWECEAKDRLDQVRERLVNVPLSCSSQLSVQHYI